MSRRLGDICRVQGGYAFKSRDFGSKGVPVIKISDVTGGGVIDYSNMQCVPINIAGQAKRFAAEPRDTLISMTGANVGKTARTGYADPEAMINQRVGRFVPDAGAGYSKDFIHYVVSSPAAYEYFANAAYGSAQPNISSTLIESLPIPSYSASIANGIGRALSSLDDKIELNRRMNETLEAMAQAIFRDWFVDFGPTRRKIEGATDPVTIMGGLVTDPDRAQELADLFPATLGGNGLPEGWEEGDLSYYALLNPENITARDVPATIEYVDLANTKWGLIEATTRYEWKDAPSRARRIIRRGDTIVGTVRPGNGSYSLIGMDGLTASTGFAALRPKSADASELVYLAATASDNIKRLEKLADGGAYPAVRADVVLATPVPIVSAVVARSFASLCAPLLKRCEHNKGENRTLAASRDALLPKLMSGEIRPPNLGIQA